MPHKLLLADDSITIQRVIELTFADENIEVITVGNGQAAIEQAERVRPDIVLADVGMPERDGYEVAAFVKSHPQLSHVPVLLLTGAFEPIDESRARAAGCDGVLVKPFEPQLVINRVKDLLLGNRPADLWAAGPTAQGPVRPPVPPVRREPPPANHAGVAPGAELARYEPIQEPPPAPPDQPGRARSDDPLEAYFDRLDAAVTARAAAPRTAEPDAMPPPADRAAAPASAGAIPPSLADAFAALLTAEGRVAHSAPAGEQTGPAPPDPEALIDAIADRVLARLHDSTLRGVVLEAAERLVREEIERLKRG